MAARINLGALTFVALLSATEGVRNGILVVCIESAENLADLDIAENTSPGSDAFVAVFVGHDFFQTRVQRDTSHPVWNECFLASGGAVHNTSTAISIVVIDADRDTPDDVIGVACTLAASSQRWLLLSGTMATDASIRGRLKIRTHLISNLQSPPDALHFTSVRSPMTTPLADNGPATAIVDCPSGHMMTSCECWSPAEPGCANARVQADLTSGKQVCHVSSNVAESPIDLPPCSPETPHEQRGITCAVPGWKPSRPAPIAASARCASISIPPVEVKAAPSRASRRDASAVTCPSGTMTGCALSTAPGLGVRFEDGDGDGRLECVGYSDGSLPAVAQALCATLDVTSEYVVSQPVIAATSFQASAKATSTVVRCPYPFMLAGCSCFSEHGNCRGAAVEHIDHIGAPGIPAHSDEVCNATHIRPNLWWTFGAEAHAICIWRGPASSLLGHGDTAGVCPTPAIHSVADKAW